MLATGLGFFARVLLRGQPVSLMIVPAVALEELSQRWIPYRMFDVGDLAADVAGVLVGTGLAIAWARRRTAAAA